MPDGKCNLSSKLFLQACQKGDLGKLENVRDRFEIDDWTVYRHDASGDTGLHVAAREGHLDVVKYLCEAWEHPLYRADVTNKDMKRPLHEAAQFARFDILQYLIERGTHEGKECSFSCTTTKNGYLFICILSNSIIIYSLILISKLAKFG